VQDLIRRNIGLNQEAIDEAGGTATAWVLSWGITQTSQLPDQWQAPDMVLAADVVYRQELFQPLLCCLDMLCRSCCTLLLMHN
jgi:predicted nicotinamide N-methyase